ncbi:AraC-type DNA-binding protein [Terribacillus aidingensis]|uniref:AraC-type DNA-binding protein n=1 Tax=Terribacillus aidingensis TaxID=586416 RepID=A0A285N1L6_9BACI|nr:AraC family transcriptional regulator [Terribacillus aidingensis]SNZ02677.1 AraC-type DNA-binding protein [Terribacillus aidingensis]
MQVHEEAIQHALTYIENNLHKSLSADEVARQAGFSQYHFHRLFQATVGLTLTDYIRRRRLAGASAMLLHTEMGILDIAFMYHFESQEAFTRAFKKYYKLPPGKYRRMMHVMLHQKEENMVEEKVTGWMLSGTDPHNYEMGIDYKHVHQGKASGYLKSKTVMGAEEFATMMQQFKAAKFAGKRIQLTCFLKTENVRSFAGMWMRVDNSSDDIIQFDNMSNRPIKGTTNWARYRIVLDVPENSAIISFGVILSGKGQVWADGFRFEEVDESVPTTNLNMTYDIQEEPVNLSFEEELV